MVNGLAGVVFYHFISHLLPFKALLLFLPVDQAFIGEVYKILTNRISCLPFKDHVTGLISC